MTPPPRKAIRLRVVDDRRPSRQDLGDPDGDQLVRARSPVAWLRPILLALGILAIAAVAVMLAAYRFGQAARPADEAERPPAETDTEQVVTGEGFDYTQTSEGKPVFRIRASHSQQDREGNSLLTTVLLDVFRENGQTFTVESRRARVNEKTWDARLEGEVVLSGWENLRLEARALELRHGGQVLESDGAVELSYPPSFVGRASSLTVDRAQDTITLAGGVHLRSVPGAPRPMRLDCQRLVYQRTAGLLRAVGEASLEGDGQSISAHYLTLFLTEGGEEIESMRARWNVVGAVTVAGVLPAEATRIEYHGEFLDMQPDPQEPAVDRIKLDGEGELVTLAVTDATGLRRAFTGYYLLGLMRDDRLTQLEGVGGPLELIETVGLDHPFPLRQVCAERITARFNPDGAIARIQLDQRVELTDPDASMFGGRQATLNLEDGLFRIEGPEVQLFNSRAEVVAHQFTYASRTGLIRAYSGVRATLAESATRALASTPLGQGRGPIQVEAEEAYWTLEPPTFQFDGQVRAWRDESLLVADQLRGDERSQEIAASGAVRTVWVPIRPGETAAPQPIAVSAERLSYVRAGGETGGVGPGLDRLLYQDGVVLEQGRRTMSCRELEVALSGAGRAERMTCEGEVVLVDAEAGRRVTGERAVYALEEEKVEIFGERVELVEISNNNRLVGRYLLYDLAAGTYILRSRRPDEEGLGSP